MLYMDSILGVSGLSSLIKLFGLEPRNGAPEVRFPKKEENFPTAVVPR